MNKELLRQRQMRAMQKRHDAGLTDKMVAHAIGCHADTLGNARLGYTELKLGTLLALEEFYASLGDYWFIADVCGEMAAARYRKRAAKLLEQAESLIANAEVLEGGAAA